MQKKLPWYSLHWSRDLNILNNQKIVCPRRSKLNNFAIETGKNFEQSDIMMISIKDNYKKSLDCNYLLGILNSKLFFFGLAIEVKSKVVPLNYMENHLKSYQLDYLMEVNLTRLLK